MKEDFDIASDGVDNYFSSFFYDAFQTVDIFLDLASESQDINDLPNEQQLALQRLWAKQAMIRDELEKAMDHGIDVIAALDLYVIDAENEHYIPIVPRYALKAITAGMALLYEPDEWLMRAERGKAFVDQMIETIKAEAEARPWYCNVHHSNDDYPYHQSNCGNQGFASSSGYFGCSPQRTCNSTDVTE